MALEATGVYWKPVWNILEGQLEVLLVNAQHVKAVPGRKSDQKDCEWIADLLQHGLLRGSFVPPRSTRELRDKLGELELALEGRLTEHHRFMLRELLDDLRHAEGKIATVEAEIDRRMRPFEQEVARLCTIPGVNRVTAWGVLAEIGLRMEQFPSTGHLASWAGLCPGSFESAGKRLSGRTRKGNASLRRCLCQAGWAISRTKGNYLSALFHRLAARRGNKRATIAVAHAVLVMMFTMLKRKEAYKELGADYFDRLHANGLRRSLVRRLERLGHKVTLEPLPIAA